MHCSSPLNFLRFLLVSIDHVTRQCLSSERHYLNNRVFVSRNYRLTVASGNLMLLKQIFFRTLVQKSRRVQLNYFEHFETKAVKAKYKI